MSFCGGCCQRVHKVDISRCDWAVQELIWRVTCHAKQQAGLDVSASVMQNSRQGLKAVHCPVRAGRRALICWRSKKRRRRCKQRQIRCRHKHMTLLLLEQQKRMFSCKF